jgi:hypothetical protein
LRPSSPGTSRSGNISLAIVVTLVAVVFLGIAATSTFRRSVTRQLQTLLFSLQIVDVAEAAITEVAQYEKLVKKFNEPAFRTEFAKAFRNGEYRGGVLFPAEIHLEIEPVTIKERFSLDPRIRIGNVKLIPLQYKIKRSQPVGLLRFVVGVTLTHGKHVFARKVGLDYEYTVFEGDDPGSLNLLISEAPKAKIYP